MKLALLLYGFEQDKSQLQIQQDKLQELLNLLDSDTDAESLFFISDGTQSIAEMQQWLLEQTEAKKYVWITKDTDIADNYILYRLNRIKNGAKTEELIELGVYTK